MSWGRYRVCIDQEKPCVVLDFETTGLKAHEHHVIEIGAIRLTPGTTHAPHFQRLVRAPRKLSARIVGITGITDAMLEADGVAPCDAMSDLIAFIGGDSVVAYNASFDIGFLNAACERHSVTIDRRGGHSCALKLARRIWPGLPSYRLGSVWDALGIKPSDSMTHQALAPHRALGDAYRTAHIYRLASRLHWEDQEARREARRIAPPPPPPRARPASAKGVADDLSGLMKKLIKAWG